MTDTPPLGSRLWLYSNFDCNLACDYCCAASSPRARPRRLPVEVAARACEEFAGLGGREILITGGEPFLDPELGELIRVAVRWAPVTVLTNAMVLARGSRRRMLDALDPTVVTMQVSLDSGTSELHDRHRGTGSFDRARAGIALLRELGFPVKVAATVDAGDAREEAGLHALLDRDGVPPADRLVRRVARMGFAAYGVPLSGRVAVAGAGARSRRRLVAPGRDQRRDDAGLLHPAAARDRAGRDPGDARRPRPRKRARGLPLHMTRQLGGSCARE